MSKAVEGHGQRLSGGVETNSGSVEEAAPVVRHPLCFCLVSSLNSVDAMLSQRKWPALRPCCTHCFVKTKFQQKRVQRYRAAARRRLNW